MNEKEAREIFIEHQNHTQKMATWECFNQKCMKAIGYLECLEQVKSLLIAIETIKKCLEDDPDHNLSPIPCMDHYGELLATFLKYKKLQKEI